MLLPVAFLALCATATVADTSAATSPFSLELLRENLKAKREALLASKDSFRSLGVTNQPAPSLEQLRGSLGYGGLQSFAHVAQLMRAIADGHSAFDVKVSSYHVSRIMCIPYSE